MDGLSFAQLVTPAGIIVAGALITALVEVLKSQLGTAISGARLAFLSSAVLYAIAAIVNPAPTLDAYLNAFAAWLACSTTAIGIKSGSKHMVEVAERNAQDEVSVSDPIV